MSWLMNWRVLGVFMIFPTIGFAILIVWKTRKIMAEIYPHLAVLCWIFANSLWMIIEFFELDESLKQLVLAPFFLGLMLILFYYFNSFNRGKGK
jgi:hypothetical protein